MAIITISRELAALGDETAQELSQCLHYRFVDKETLETRIKSFGIADRKFRQYDERRPSLLASISQDKDNYLHYLKTAILTEASEGNVVMIGRGATVMFREVPGVLSVFLTAPLDIRLQRIKNYFNCDDKRAQQILERSDKDRAGFHQYFFEMDWHDSGNYHLSLNTGYLHPSLCAEIIRYLRDELITEEAESQQALRLQDLILAQQVKHHLLYEKEISIHFLEISVSQELISLYGVANSQAIVEAAVSAVQEAAPLMAVQSEMQIVREYKVMP
ncbi:MAG: cytidylate kinase-like family protein [Spirochaetaceae bacterium]|jgi:cytidylate kinase|nr:cytidylate kinase-like family protein [Spirochaetaceae bacterium]